MYECCEPPFSVRGRPCRNVEFLKLIIQSKWFSRFKRLHHRLVRISALRNAYEAL